MKTATKLATLAIMMFVMVMTGCTSGPSDADLNTQVKPKLISPFFDVVNLKKVSSSAAEQNGVKVYEVKYEAEVKFKRNCEDVKKEIAARDAVRNKNMVSNMFDYSDKGREKGLKDAHASIDDMNLQTELSMVKSIFGTFKAGEVQKMTKSCTFIKADNGWRLKD